MAHQHIPQGQAPTLSWLPADTEESVLGTNLHQEVIRELVSSLEWAAEQGARWGVGGQTRIDGFRRRDGTVVPLLPDVFVYPHPLDLRRGAYSLTLDGPPLLTIEVASEGTWRTDINVEAGKAYAYAAAGVREYLVFDPTGEFLAERVRAWRQKSGQFIAWPAGRDGRWHSQELPVSFAVDGLFLRVYTADNRPVEFDHEARAALAELRRTVAHLSSVRAPDDASETGNNPG